MAEHMLVQHNTAHQNIPLVLLRPSIVGTAANEPMPGWTDASGIIQGITLTVGLGILRDLPGVPEHIADIVPVDYIVRQILVSIPFILAQKGSLFITHCTSSSTNPMTWNTFFRAITKYQN